MGLEAIECLFLIYAVFVFPWIDDRVKLRQIHMWPPKKGHQVILKEDDFSILKLCVSYFSPGQGNVLFQTRGSRMLS